MKPIRIVQIVLLVLAIIYLLLLHNQNPANLALPLFISLPPALVIALALFIGWLVGWSVGQLGHWRQARELKALQDRIDELEQHLPNYDERAPVIPDRTDPGLRPVD